MIVAMNDLWLIRIGEIRLKKGNRAFFERVLRENLRRKVSEWPDSAASGSSIVIRNGRFYLETDLPEDAVRRILATTPGVVGYSRAKRVGKTLDELGEASVAVAREMSAPSAGGSFKLEIRRTDKSLPMDSYGYARELGRIVLDRVPELRVDVHEPDFVIGIELRESGYVYGNPSAGVGGLPVGTVGRGLLLLSGGIDSPVAGQLMAKRGLKLGAVHFHTPPFTSDEAHDKVIRLASLLAPWCEGLTLYSVPFTECQVLVKDSVDPAAVTLHSRAAMMRIAEQIAGNRRFGALITGESLGQVASQTLDSIRFTDSVVDLPVFRPLIGLDKEEIIRHARLIGTFETSIEPFDDCCTLFSPEHPVTRPDKFEEIAVFDGIDGLEDCMDRVVRDTATFRFDTRGRRIVTGS